ncbi:MAG: transposase, partial [Clostridium sp.]|nr:transposase [Clostridium sp.]
INSNQSIKIHKGLSVQEKPLNEEYSNTIGIDKGYTKMLSCSNGIEYGVELGKLLSKRTEELKDKNAKRNKLYALAKKYSEEGNDKKAQNILKNNLGYIKKDRETRRFKAKTESYINYNINQFIKDAKPMEVIKEDLTFSSKKRDNKSKAYNHKMSMWVKGVLNDRLEYKLKYNGIKFTDINPAYTSQTCHKCGQFGVRDNDLFTCPKCGTTDANINASINILNRKNDKEIKLVTSYKEVENILKNRLKTTNNKEEIISLI